MRRLSTGEVHAPWATQFAYPFRWFYSVLRAADYFRTASLHEGRRPDDRMAEALELIRAARDADGTWHQRCATRAASGSTSTAAPARPRGGSPSTRCASSPGGTAKSCPTARRAKRTPTERPDRTVIADCEHAQAEPAGGEASKEDATTRTRPGAAPRRLPRRAGERPRDPPAAAMCGSPPSAWPLSAGVAAVCPALQRPAWAAR